MKRTAALIVIAALIFSNCAARGPALRVDGPAAGYAGPHAEVRTGTTGTATEQDDEIWRQYAAHLPIGSAIRIRTTGGERLTAVLLTVDDSGLTVKPRTRIPEPARHFPFRGLAQLELARDGSNLAKAAAIGGGVGAGVFLGLLLLLFANVD
ncbi:MAG: hypothetical protein ABI868_03410 [Acidobacteriota bacterium]